MSSLTVEQLDLLRRLKTAGFTADTVAEAFRAMERIETALPADVPEMESAFSSASTVPVQTSPTSTTNPLSLASTSAAVNQENSLLRHLQQLAAQQSTSFDLQQQQQRCAFTTVPESCVFGTQATSVQHSEMTPLGSSIAVSSGQITTTNALNTFQQQFRPATMTTARPIRSQRQPMKDITTLEDPNELDQFMSQGEEACINDMKKFITQYSLRQTTVAQMTGVSQPYISKLLNGNHRELSLRCRRNIYAWYLNCRRHPAIYCQDPTTRLETNGDGELVPQRRERYVFRPILIRMLEQFFAESPFPDGNKRSEIAQACNNALQAEKRGSALMPKEIVTPQVIANWFANKRKEFRRKNNEESRSRHFHGLPHDPEQSPSPRPSGFVDSPNATNLLPPLQFGGPLSLFSQQHQQASQQNPSTAQASISVENFLEAQRPLLQLPAIQSPLQELLQRSVQQLQFQQQSKLEARPSVFEGNAVAEEEGKVTDDSTTSMPILSAMKEEISLESSAVDEQMSVQSSTSSNHSSPAQTICDDDVKETVTSAQTAYNELMEKMLNSGMLHLMQQLNGGVRLTTNME